MRCAACPAPADSRAQRLPSRSTTTVTRSRRRQSIGGPVEPAGVITKSFPDGVKKHKFIRVDTHTSKDDAVAFSITKAQQIIDEQGDRIFRNA